MLYLFNVRAINEHIYAYLLPHVIENDLGLNAVGFKVYVKNGKNILGGAFSCIGTLPTVRVVQRMEVDDVRFEESPLSVIIVIKV